MTTVETQEPVEPGGLLLEKLTSEPEIGFRFRAAPTEEPTWYPFAPHFRWSLRERHRFGSLYQQMLELESAGELKESDSARYDTLLNELCRMAAPTFPDDALASLLDIQKSALVMDFLQQLGTATAEIVPKGHLNLINFMRQASRQTGGSPSRASRRSTGRRGG